MFPKLSTTGAAVRLGVFLHIFDIGKVMFVHVEIKSTRIMAKRSVNQLCRKFRRGVVVILSYLIFSHLVQESRQRCLLRTGAPDQPVLLALSRKISSSQVVFGGIVHSNDAHRAPDFSDDIHCRVPGLGRSRDYRCRFSLSERCDPRELSRYSCLGKMVNCHLAQ